MLNREKTGLAIFDNFHIDRELPKYKKTAEERAQVKVARGLSGVDTFGGAHPIASAEMMTPQEFPQSWEFDDVAGPNFGFDDNATLLSVDGGELRRRKPGEDWADRILDQKAYLRRKARSRFFRFLYSWILPKPNPELPKISVQLFFELVKENCKDIENYSAKVNEFLKVAAHAKKMGQTAMYEKIIKDVHMVKHEALLYAGNFKTCITEEQIVQFYKESEKGLSLHFVKNFNRVIPEEVANQKTKADELLVFDNYAVLHYDKDQKAFRETQAEKEKRKDPILFGLISGIRKLYYIADWKDEYCDLTLQQLIDKFGEKAIEANNISVNYNRPK